MPSTPRPPLLERLALHRTELRAWAMYDWGNSAFFTTVVSAVFPVYLFKVADASLTGEETTAALMWANAGALGFTALMAPFLGAIADMGGLRKRFLAVFLAIGVTATAGLFFVEPGKHELGLWLFALANVGAFGTMVFYDALLPHIASDGELDQLSTSAYALGYLGGGLLLAAQLLVISNPGWLGVAEDSTLLVRLVLLSVAVWWVLFSIPLFRCVTEPVVKDRPRATAAVRAAFVQLTATVKELKLYRHAMVLLIAYLVYADGIGTVFRLAAVYSKEIGFDDKVIITALLLTQFLGVPAAFAFGRLAAKTGTKRAILGALVVYMLACLLGSQMRTEVHLFTLAGMIALVQGGTQALSRSLFASMIPKKRSAEFFAVFAIFEKVGGLFGPIAFIQLQRAFSDPGVPGQGSRYAVACVAIVFVIGFLLLTRVDVDAGREAVARLNASDAGE